MQNVIGSRIKFLRVEAGLTQRDVAEKLNIANSTLSQYEQGDRMPSVGMQRNLAQYFGVSVDFLIGLTDDRTPKPERPSYNPAPTDPAYLEALSYLDGLSDAGMEAALHILKSIKTLDEVKNAPSGVVPLEKNA